MQTGSSWTNLTINPFLFRPVLAALLLGFLLLSPGRLQAHGPENHLPPLQDQAARQQEEAVGLDEDLGAKIPFDIILRDEAGQPVRLGELVTVPTIILPVYYSCTNICVTLLDVPCDQGFRWEDGERAAKPRPAAGRGLPRSLLQYR